MLLFFTVSGFGFISLLYGIRMDPERNEKIRIRHGDLVPVLHSYTRACTKQGPRIWSMLNWIRIRQHLLLGSVQFDLLFKLIDEKK